MREKAAPHRRLEFGASIKLVSIRKDPIFFVFNVKLINYDINKKKLKYYL